VQQVFPDAKVARMDVDSMRGKRSMTELLDQLEKRKIDILVGTQMVVKGLDFASVSLVGILSADSLLSYPDFRVNERAFQLMEQVSGRAGRVDGKGRVLIQAYNVAHPALQWVKDHDVHAFYTNEIVHRQIYSYPPFSRLIKIIIKHKDEPKAIGVAALMAQALQDFHGITIQGPAPALVMRVRNQYIHEIWLKSPRDSSTLTALKSFLKTQKDIILSKRGNSNVVVVFDVDPV
jgi:primosomal protein N' (replication factor Y)